MRALFFLAVLSLIACSLLDPADAFGSHPFHDAARRGDVKQLRRQVLAGHNVDARDSQGQTALMAASRAGKPDAIRFLLQEGAVASMWTNDATKIGGRGWTELDFPMRALEERIKERKAKGRSWKEQNPPHLDATLCDLSECVELLKGSSWARTWQGVYDAFKNNPVCRCLPW